uniref:SCP domain-containing protein n=1 Tax=Steinernema glaseri TaxID=37863 RepID=A0A1I7YNB8_9BILA
MSATTGASLALLALLTVVGGQVQNVDVVVSKYEALGYPEISAFRNSPYSFSFCLCSRATTDPDRSGSCSCQNNIRGKTAAQSVPRAVFSARCMHSLNPSKCLGTRFHSVSESQQLLYIKVELDSRTLSSPSWQLIPNSAKRTNSKITAFTRTGDIRLSYVVLPSKSNERTSPVARTTTLRDLPEFPTYPKMATFLKRYGQLKNNVRKTTKVLAMESTKANVGNTLDQIRNYLMNGAMAEKLVPKDFDLNTFRRSLTDAHNRFRAVHKAGPLQYDLGIERSAQAWADHLANQEACLKHDPMRRYGENLFFFGGSVLPSAEATAASVAKSFYIEGDGYNFNDFRPREIHRVGHFTQMIWRSTEKMGVGVAIRQSTGHRSSACLPRKGMHLIYVVVKYDPPGNVLSEEQFLSNVRSG